MRVYIAASSMELERVDYWAAQLVAAGIEVSSTWPISVREHGANPRESSNRQRSVWALRCLDEIRESYVVWFLVPPLDKPTRGAWAELQLAYSLDIVLICSGDTRQSVFCALGEEYATDVEAFNRIVSLT